MQKRLIALIAGLIYPLGFAPYAFWPAVLISIAILTACLRDSTPKAAAWIGFCYGCGLFGLGVSWLYVSIHTYGFTPIWLAVPLTGLFCATMALYFALLGWLSARFHHQLIAFCGLWILGDWLRGWLLTGFPWLYPGYALIDTPLAGLAPVGGIWLISLVAVLSGSAISQLYHGIRHNQWRSLHHGQWSVLALAAAGWIAALPLAPSLWVTPIDRAPQTVALVQGNIPQDIKWLTTEQSATRNIYAELTREVQEPALIVWPESAVTEFYQEALPFLHQQGDAVAQRGGALISGVPWRTNLMRGYQYHNSIAVLGGGQGVYHKQKLVPFGEYVPLQNVLRGIIPFFDLPMSSFTRGKPTQDNLAAIGLIIAPFICYEILYPELVAARSHDANVLLTVSNDAWFGTSAGPLQHFQMARMRALETGRWLMRGTNNGVTAIVDPNGQVQASLAQFERGTLTGTVQAMHGTTPFMHTGGWPTWLLALIMCLSAVLTRPKIRAATDNVDLNQHDKIKTGE